MLYSLFTIKKLILFDRLDVICTRDLKVIYSSVRILHRNSRRYRNSKDREVEFVSIIHISSRSGVPAFIISNK